MKKYICILTALSAMTAGAFTTNEWIRAVDNNWTSSGNWSPTVTNWTDYSACLVFGVGDGSNYWMYDNIVNAAVASMTFTADSPSNYSINYRQIFLSSGDADGNIIVNNMDYIAKFENPLVFNYGTSADRYVRANNGAIWLTYTTYYTSTAAAPNLHFCAADGANILFKAAGTLSLPSTGNQYLLTFEGDGIGGTIDLNSRLSFSSSNSDPGLNLIAKNAITVNLNMTAGQVTDIALQGAVINWADTNMVAGDIIFEEGDNKLAFAGFGNDFATLAIDDAAGNNVLDFDGGDCVIAFDDSSSLSWQAGLVISNFDSGDSLRFGTDANGLTSAQLASITLNGSTGVALDSNGYVISEIGSMTIDSLSGTNGVTLSWNTVNGLSYAVQSKPDLPTTNWLDSITGIAGTGGDVTVTTSVEQAQSFYRVVVE